MTVEGQENMSTADRTALVEFQQKGSATATSSQRRNSSCERAQATAGGNQARDQWRRLRCRSVCRMKRQRWSDETTKFCAL